MLNKCYCYAIDVELPKRTRLAVVQKQPEPFNHLKPFPKMAKEIKLMRGPEEVHNKIIYGEYGIQVTFTNICCFLAHLSTKCSG